MQRIGGRRFEPEAQVELPGLLVGVYDQSPYPHGLSGANDAQQSVLQK